MSKKHDKPKKMKRETYEKELAQLEVDLVKLQGWIKAKGLKVGCAPDTFLGGGNQTCRKLIDDGWIGKPIGFTAFMAGHGAVLCDGARQFIRTGQAGVRIYDYFVSGTRCYQRTKPSSPPANARQHCPLACAKEFRPR